MSSTEVFDPAVAGSNFQKAVHWLQSLEEFQGAPKPEVKWSPWSDYYVEVADVADHGELRLIAQRAWDLFNVPVWNSAWAAPQL